MTVYIDTSAAAKLVVEEDETSAVKSYLNDRSANDIPLVSSLLLETELRRLAVRYDLEQSTVADVLRRFDLIEPDRALFTEAGLLPGKNLRSLDALHLATAVRADVDVVLAYDRRMADAAQAIGLQVAAPS